MVKVENLQFLKQKKIYKVSKTTYDKILKNIKNSVINDFIFQNTRVKADIFRVTENTKVYLETQTAYTKLKFLILKICCIMSYSMYILQIFNKIVENQDLFQNEKDL